MNLILMFCSEHQPVNALTINQVGTVTELSFENNLSMNRATYKESMLHGFSSMNQIFFNPPLDDPRLVAAHQSIVGLMTFVSAPIIATGIFAELSIPAISTGMLLLNDASATFSPTDETFLESGGAFGQATLLALNATSIYGSFRSVRYFGQADEHFDELFIAISIGLGVHSAIAQMQYMNNVLYGGYYNPFAISYSTSTLPIFNDIGGIGFTLPNS